MSLSSIIHDNPEIRNGLKARVVRPKIIFDRSVYAPPLTTNYQIVGTAFDYLLRFFLERVNVLAKAEPGASRKSLRKGVEANATHGSDAPETARDEIAYFFRSLEVVARR